MTATPCPGAEDLARLIDGDLDPRERAALLAHVASCSSCLEVVGGSVRTLEAEGLAGSASSMRAWQRPALAMAAVLVVAAGIAALVLRSRWSPPDAIAGLPSASQLAAELPKGRGGPPPAWSPAGAPGAYATAEQRRSTLEFRTGVRLLDLDVALRAGDRVAAGSALADIVSLISALQASVDLIERYRALQPLVATGRLAETNAAAADAERRLGGSLRSSYLALGSWCEAGRMSAELGKGRVAWPAEASALLRSVSEREVPPEVVTALRDIAEPEPGRSTDETRQRAGWAFTRILELM